jgi:hypothetical protein
MAQKTAYFEKAALNSWLRASTLAVSGSNASTSNILTAAGATAGFNVGDVVQVSALSTLHRVTAVPDNTHVTVSPVTSGTVTTGNLIRVAYAPSAVYVGLFTAAPTDAGGGTEATGGSYARVQLSQADATWAAPAGNVSTAISGANARPRTSSSRPRPDSWPATSSMDQQRHHRGQPAHGHRPCPTARTSPSLRQPE